MTCPHCSAVLDRPPTPRPPTSTDFVLCLNCGKRSPWLDQIGGVRVRIERKNMNRSELVLFGGGRRLDLLGVKVGDLEWDLSHAGVHKESLRRVLPRLEEIRRTE